MPVADAPGPWPLTETVFDPSMHAATVFVGGRRVASGYRGNSQFHEGFGLMVAVDGYTAPRGDADFSLILLQIR